MATIKSFEELEVWQLSMSLAKDVYKVSGRKEVDFGLRDQIRRAVVSVSSNVAEGFEYNNNKEFVRFLKYAKGSAGEVRSQLYLMKELGMINEEEYLGMSEKIVLISKKLKSFMGHLVKFSQQL